MWLARVAIVVCALAVPRLLAAQAVRGVVAFVATGQPSAGAQVQLIPVGGDPLPAVLTGQGGEFFVTAPAAGEYDLRVSFAGYRVQLARLQLRDDLVLEVQVNLAREDQRSTGDTLNLNGRVLSTGDGDPLSNVHVQVLESSQSTRTDIHGRFTLHNVARRASVAFQRIGVKPDTMVLQAGQPFVTVYLEPTPVTLPPVEATGALVERQRFESLAQPSTFSLDKVAIEATPTLAEPDVARTVQLLPGTVAKNDFYVGFNVRGGEADQNLIRLDGVTVFNPTHVGGLFSTFDEAAVDRVDFITGGFPAHYGGRMSSVLDVQLRTGSRQSTRLRGHVSLLSGKVMVEGPVGSSGITYLASARRSYVDMLAAPFSGKGVPYYFADALTKVTVPLPTGGTASLTGYWGRDALDWPFIEDEPGREGLDIEFSWGNRLAGLAVRHALGAVDLEHHVSVSAFSTTLAVVPDIRRLDNRARVLTAGLSATLRLGQANHVTIGGDVEDYAMELSGRSEALQTVEFELDYSPSVWSAYVDAQWELLKRVQLRPGLRVERVTGGADQTVVAPRVAAKAFLTDDFALTASAGRFYQAIHSIRDRDVPLTVFDFWIGADDLTPIAYADHIIVGFEQWFGTKALVRVEGYDKAFHDLVVRSFRDDPKIRGDEFFAADGYARGFDVFIRKFSGNITGWVAYGFTKTLRTTDSLTFPPSHDRRHTLNIVVQAPGPLHSELGVRLGYGSPLPYTGIVGQWLHRNYNSELHGFDYFDSESVSEEINGERYPYYARLDVGLRWRLEKWGGVLRPYVQIVNAFNRTNVWVYAFEFDRSPPTRSGLSQLPFFPTAGVAFEF